jgi:hypothetical protein
MVLEKERGRAGESFLGPASPFIQFISLLGIPAAGGVAVIQAVQIPRFIYGQAVPVLLAAELGSLLALAGAVAGVACVPCAPIGAGRAV